MKDRLRITMILPAAGLGGGIRVLAFYAQGLHERGHKVVVVSRPWPTVPLGRRLLSLARGRGWPVSRARRPSHLDGKAFEHRVLESPRAVTDADVPDADVVVATWWDTAPAVAALSDAKGAKCYFMQDYGAAGQPLDQIIQTWRLPLHIITIAPWLRDLMVEHGVEGSTIDMAYNGVDAQRFSAPPRGKQARPTVGFIYTALPEKGVDTALAAIAAARREVPELQVVAFGPRERYPHLPLPEGTEYFGGVADEALASIYSRCDAWLFSSRREGFGLPLLEAMACRTPVIGTPAGVAPQLLAEAGGILLPSFDAAPMARAIVDVARMDESTWRSLSDSSLATARRYPWEAGLDSFEAGLRRCRERAARGEIAGGLSSVHAVPEKAAKP